MLVREYNGLDMISFGIKKEDLEKGDVLVIVFDESEASKSTLRNLSLSDFKGKVYLFAAVGVQNFEPLPVKGKVYSITEKTYRSWGISNLPSILYLRNGKTTFWIDGLNLNVADLLKNLSAMSGN